LHQIVSIIRSTVSHSTVAREKNRLKHLTGFVNSLLSTASILAVALLGCVYSISYARNTVGVDVAKLSLIQ